jgi:hypothetical protein
MTLSLPNSARSPTPLVALLIGALITYEAIDYSTTLLIFIDIILLKY